MGMGPLHFSDQEDEFGTEPLSEINVTPMVDVMLVLLVIFMVAAPLMTVGVPVQLPTSAAQKVSQPKPPIVISIDADGQPFLEKEMLDQTTMMPRLRALAGRDPSQVIQVRGDRSVPYGRVIEIMGQISAAGFSKVTLIAQMPPGPVSAP